MIRRLVRFDNAEGRGTPLLLLAELRVIDPTAELVYLGAGLWWLGTVRANEERQKAGEFILALEARRDKPNPRNVTLGVLAAQGFARVQAYSCHGDPALDRVTDAEGHVCSIVEDFRERDAHWRRDQGRDVFRHRLEASTNEEARRQADAEYRHYLMTDGRAHYRREVRNRVMFGAAGMTGGAGRATGGIAFPH